MLTQENETIDLTIFRMSQVEMRAFNLIFKKLSEARDNKITEGELFKFLSGMRVVEGSNEKIKAYESKAFLKSWDKSGFVTKIHGDIRLGSIFLYIDILNKENREAVIKKLGLEQKASLYSYEIPNKNSLTIP